MVSNLGKPGIRNIVEVPWQQYPDHFGGALSKALVGPGDTDIKLIDYRISSYQPIAYVAPHTNKVQEQIYHVIEGEGSMDINGETNIVRRHDVIHIPPGIEHSITNTGLDNLVFIVVTAPVSDE